MADTNKIERPLLRMATAILDSLRQAIVEPQLPVLPQREWDRAQQLRRQLLIARQRGWQGAAEELLWDFKGAVRILSRYVDAGCREIDSLPDESAKPLLNLRQMYDELDALQTEFGEFDCDLKQHTISTKMGRQPVAKSWYSSSRSMSALIPRAASAEWKADRMNNSEPLLK